MNGGAAAFLPEAYGGTASIYVAGIISATIPTTAADISAAHATSYSPSSNATLAKIFFLECLRLRMLCGMATDTEIPSIWQEFALVPTRLGSLAILVY